MGIIMAAVAVLEIHSEMKAVAARKPAEEPARIGAHAVHDAQGDAPVEVPLLHGRGDPHAAGEEEDVGIDVGQHGLPDVRPQPGPKTPSSGKRTSGTQAVSRSGIASVSHQIAMSAAPAAA